MSLLKCAALFISIYCQDALHLGSASFYVLVNIELYVSIQGNNPLLPCSSDVLGNVITFGFCNIISINVSSCVSRRELFTSCLFWLALLRRAWNEVK